MPQITRLGAREVWGRIWPHMGLVWPVGPKMLYTTLFFWPPCWADISRFWAEIATCFFSGMVRSSVLTEKAFSFA